MVKKRILLVAADPQIIADFQSALGKAWDVATADIAGAPGELEKQSRDVVVADLSAGETEGLEFLNRIQLLQPKSIRFILSLETDRERIMKKALGAHQFLGKPIEAENLKQALDRALALESWIPRNSVRELVARVRMLPTIPSLYLEVQKLLKNPDTTTEEIGAIIAKDMAMMTKLLQVINSAAFAVHRRITSPTEAVGLLGFETVNSMVMAIKVLGDFDKVKPVYFSIDKIWRHSTKVARNAKGLAMLHTDDRALAEMAFTGGLMHDLGKVVLASNFDEQYRGAQSLAAKQQLPLWEVEREIFGATHGEMGAYLLGLWGMPLEVMAAAALHHEPARGNCDRFTPLTAVHVANALAYEELPEKERAGCSKIDEAYLAKAGVLENLDAWRKAVTTLDFTKKSTKPKVNITMAAPMPLPEKEKPQPKQIEIPKEAPAVTPVSIWKQRWFFPTAAGIAALVLVVGLVCLLAGHKTGTDSDGKSAMKKVSDSLTPIETVHARTPETTAPTQPSLQSATAKAESPKVADVRAHSPTASQSSSSGYGTNFADLKLQGIFFSSRHPRAIISGLNVQAGDHIGGVVVLDVNATGATIEYQDQVKVLTLK